MTTLTFDISVESKNKTLVSCKNFSFRLNCVNFIFGESGIGKTLLCKTVMGLLEPDTFRIKINNENYIHYKSHQQCTIYRENGFFVFQEPSTHLNPLRTLNEQLNEGVLNIDTSQHLEILKNVWGESGNNNYDSILSLYPRPYRPSGGEKQRILLAMAFKKLHVCQNKSMSDGLFIFDEPTGCLDNFNRNIFLHYLYERFKCKKFTSLIITHDYSIISQIFKKHHECIGETNFFELKRKNSTEVVLENFRPDQYSKWLSNESVFLSTPDSKTVFQSDEHFRLFGKKFTFYKDSFKHQKVRLTIRKGEVAYLKAPSGVGKTSFAKLLLGLLRAQEIKFFINDTVFSNHSPQHLWRKKVWGKLATMVFQHADEALNKNASVRQTIATLPGITLNEDVFRELKLIFGNTFDNKFLRKKVLHLSGGQKQRLNIIRGFLLTTDLLVLDEPLNGLDFESIKQVLDLLRKKCAKGLSVLLISHNEEIFDTLISPDLIYYLDCE